MLRRTKSFRAARELPNLPLEEALVRRERWLVHDDDDSLWTEYKGGIWPTAKAVPAFGDQSPLGFYVDRDGEIVFLERAAGGKTWFEVVAKRTKRDARATT
jgi:hypothetical protein